VSIELLLRLEMVKVLVARVPTVVVGKVTEDATLIMPPPAGVGVAVGVEVFVIVGDALAEGTDVGATVGIGVATTVGVEVLVMVGVAVRVAVAVGVDVLMIVGVAVAVRVAVDVAVGVAVAVRVGDDDGERKFFTAPAKTLKSIEPHPVA